MSLQSFESLRFPVKICYDDAYDKKRRQMNVLYKIKRWNKNMC